MNVPRDSLLKPREIQQYLWDYFALHANQRMSVFKFFITLAVFVTATLVAAVVQGHHMVGMWLGLLLVCIAAAFWKLDERTRYLITNSEDALKDMEARYVEGASLQVFTNDHWKRDRRCGTYSQCFGFLFGVFALAGFIGFFVSACNL